VRHKKSGPAESRGANCEAGADNRESHTKSRLKQCSAMSRRQARALLLVEPGMKVRLTRKHAERIDDVDLEGRGVGDVLDLGSREANLLIAERWAIPERRGRELVTAHQRRTEDSFEDKAF
jgi:hypothetical protein